MNALALEIPTRAQRADGDGMIAYAGGVAFLGCRAFLTDRQAKPSNASDDLQECALDTLYDSHRGKDRIASASGVSFPALERRHK